MENEKVLSDGNVICEECSEEDLKVGEEEWKDHSSDTKNGLNVYKDNASDKSQTSDLGVSSDLSISNTPKHALFGGAGGFLLSLES